MPKVQGECEECGADTEYWPSQARRFCSLTCRSKWRVRTEAPPTKPRTGRYDPCEVCDSPVWRRQHQIRDGLGRYCSPACHNKGQRVDRVPLTCEHCGSGFALVPSALKYSAGRFCSKRCEGLARIVRPLERDHNGKPARLNSDGYVWVWEPDHPDASGYGGWLAEHRLVAEQIIGRRLTSSDEVHHANRDKTDNRPQNLEVLDGVTHSRITLTQRLSDRELLARYIEKFGPLD